ncbi:MAG TPA: 3-hydroxyacyl-ACP dehydratase [Agriterribacter sp.]|nr:3-hydroxyacyl-ACP dehydratase [Agriterribacter sp.]
MAANMDILALIPQRPPFVMVDELLAADAETASAKYTVNPDNIFMKNGQLTEPALIEHIAQTAAARIGYIYSRKGEPVPVGFIGAVQHLQVMDLPKAGQVLNTEISIKNQVFDVTIIAGKIFCNGHKIAECEMKIFVQSTNKTTIQ